MNRADLAITCHWIDKNFRLQEALLEFKKLNGRHIGSMLAAEVFNTLKEYEIVSKLFCITTDNASNNSRMMKELSKRLSQSCNIKWDPKAQHILCLNYVINLAVQAFLKAIKAVNTIKDTLTEEHEDHISEGNDMFNEDNEDEIENEDDEDEPIVEMEYFSETMEKIRKIVKVCLKSMTPISVALWALYSCSNLLINR